MAAEIDRALEIDGWMSEAELRWLGEQASHRRVIAEIGSYLGRSTRALADNAIGVVYAIDDWYGPRDVDWLTAEERKTVFERFYMNMLDTNVVPINSNHATASIPESPDMVFIDGDHEYESVIWDIYRWLPRIVPGGIICGHDAYKAGVDKAVREAFGHMTIAPETTIWYHEL